MVHLGSGVLFGTKRKQTVSYEKTWIKFNCILLKDTI